MTITPSPFEIDLASHGNEVFGEKTRGTHLTLVPDFVEDKIAPHEVISSTSQLAPNALPTDETSRERAYSRPQNVATPPHSSTLYLGSVAGTDCYGVPRYKEEV